MAKQDILPFRIFVGPEERPLEELTEQERAEFRRRNGERMQAFFTEYYEDPDHFEEFKRVFHWTGDDGQPA